MSGQPKLQKFTDISRLVTRFRDDLRTSDFVLIYAFNGTGKTRLSMEFKERGKRGGLDIRDTLYFNAFTEDLFNWDNDLEHDSKRVLKFNSESKFFEGFKELAIEQRIQAHLDRYADFSFDIVYENSEITFKKNVLKKIWENGEQIEKNEIEYNIKICRSEENIFIWCVFLSICDLAIERDNAYQWVQYIYIDDPISSLDENNAIALASDLAQLLKTGIGKTKTIISSHHCLFFNVMCNELKNKNLLRYFLHKNGSEGFTLQKTDDTPFFHHVASLSELKSAVVSDNIKTYHFNQLRSILEKTSSFFGFNEFGKCIHGLDDEVLFQRALNLLSHGKYSIYEPIDMSEDNKDLFKRILLAFLEKYKFDLPALLIEEAATPVIEVEIPIHEEATPVEQITPLTEEEINLVDKPSKTE